MKEITEYCDRCHANLRNTGDRCNYPMKYTKPSKGNSYEVDLCLACAEALESFILTPYSTKK